jgi:hypothetical protein
MVNRLLEEVEYKIEETRLGVWRRYGYESGQFYHEFKSHASWLGLPLIHYTFGKCPETGRRVVAKGVVAVGRLACGIIAIGHASFGLVAVGQLALGLVLGIGQLATGLGALGQFGVGVLFGLAQFATGYIAIGQFALGKYVLAQIGAGRFVWSMTHADPQAIDFFKSLPVIRYFLG